jgi:hypothetical protein
MLIGFCKGTKAYRFMCMKTNKINKNKDVMFTKDKENMKNNLMMRPSGRNEVTIVVGIDEYSDLLLFDIGEDIEECDEQVEYTVPRRQGRQKIILQKNAEKINKFIKYFVEIYKNEVNKNCRQKTKENV